MSLSIMLKIGNGFHSEGLIQALVPALERPDLLLQIVMVSAGVRFLNCGFSRTDQFSIVVQCNRTLEYPILLNMLTP